MCVGIYYLPVLQFKHHQTWRHSASVLVYLEQEVARIWGKYSDSWTVVGAGEPCLLQIFHSHLKMGAARQTALGAVWVAGEDHCNQTGRSRELCFWQTLDCCQCTGWMHGGLRLCTGGCWQRLQVCQKLMVQRHCC